MEYYTRTYEYSYSTYFICSLYEAQHLPGTYQYWYVLLHVKRLQLLQATASVADS